MMPGLDAITQFESLPLYAQALTAVRMVRRAAMAKLPPDDSEARLIMDACNAAEACCFSGEGVYQNRDLFDHAMKLAGSARPVSGRDWLHRAVHSAIDALRAADACQERPFERSVTVSAQAAIAALGEDENLSRMQIAILLASDIDQLLFACGEVDKLPSRNVRANYEGLGRHVAGRLAPVHPLEFIPRTPTPEELAR